MRDSRRFCSAPGIREEATENGMDADKVFGPLFKR
jgi:hypothetical protein